MFHLCLSSIWVLCLPLQSKAMHVRLIGDYKLTMDVTRVVCGGLSSHVSPVMKLCRVLPPPHLMSAGMDSSHSGALCGHPLFIDDWMNSDLLQLCLMHLVWLRWSKSHVIGLEIELYHKGANRSPNGRVHSRWGYVVILFSWVCLEVTHATCNLWLVILYHMQPHN